MFVFEFVKLFLVVDVSTVSEICRFLGVSDTVFFVDVLFVNFFFWFIFSICFNFIYRTFRVLFKFLF